MPCMCSFPQILILHKGMDFFWTSLAQTLPSLRGKRKHFTSTNIQVCFRVAVKEIANQYSRQHCNTILISTTQRSHSFPTVIFDSPIPLSPFKLWQPVMNSIPPLRESHMKLSALLDMSSLSHYFCGVCVSSDCMCLLPCFKFPHQPLLRSILRKC